MTIPEIAEAVSASEETIRSTIRYVKKMTGRNIEYFKRPKNKAVKVKATAQQRHAAIELEARRRGMSYGQLSAVISFTDADRIVNEYMERKIAAAKKKMLQCKGCSYWVGGSCSFHLTGRLRRKDADGLCLEKTSDKRRRMWFGK